LSSKDYDKELINLNSANEYEEGVKGRRRQWHNIEEAVKLIPDHQQNALQRAIELFEKVN